MHESSVKVGERDAEVKVKEKDGSGAMTVCKQEAGRGDKGWNSQSCGLAGSMRERTSSQPDLSVHKA